MGLKTSSIYVTLWGHAPPPRVFDIILSKYMSLCFGWRVHVLIFLYWFSYGDIRVKLRCEHCSFEFSCQVTPHGRAILRDRPICTCAHIFLVLMPSVARAKLPFPENACKYQAISVQITLFNDYMCQ